MTPRIVSGLLLFCLVAPTGLPAQTGPESRLNQARDKVNPAASGFAVVELFTSEGCSSCPPAEALLAEIAQHAAAAGEPVYALAFHVDYWDYLGWKDVFADKAFSARQRRYAEVLRSPTIYTPQMVVNGETEFVGSDRRSARSAIQRALRREPAFRLHLTRVSAAGQTPLRVRYRLSAVPKNAVLNLALVERALVRNIARGENAGRTLHHENVVRRLQVYSVKNPEGQLALEIPAAVKIPKSSLVAFVQDARSLRILAAAALPLHQ
ncbi:MAG: DUF1223 domain-containing protein [Calditrichaeota bacterium]|nr:MAG: DUF1223 domain-containing protein [Calditrichota bacterium]